jgi:hypothetical protein
MRRGLTARMEIFSWPLMDIVNAGMAIASIQYTTGHVQANPMLSGPYERATTIGLDGPARSLKTTSRRVICITAYKDSNVSSWGQ